MEGLPVTVRLLDPPLHEFVPHDEKGQAEMAKVMGVPMDLYIHSPIRLHGVVLN
jgi:pyruvate,orthophosphate dikinase